MAGASGASVTRNKRDTYSTLPALLIRLAHFSVMMAFKHTFLRVYPKSWRRENLPCSLRRLATERLMTLFEMNALVIWSSSSAVCLCFLHPRCTGTCGTTLLQGQMLVKSLLFRASIAGAAA